MNIVVCVKQVPGTTNVAVDPETGTLVRDGVEGKLNPYDLFALETAFELKDRYGGTVSTVTMGPPQAKTALLETVYMGADRGVLISDRKFAGADVLATSYTLVGGIKKLDCDLIVCGKLTTDGDTAQFGAEIAEHLGCAHAANVTEVLAVTDTTITVRMNLETSTQVHRMRLPCLICVDKDINSPRLPSCKRKWQTDEEKQISVLTFDDMEDRDPAHYGLAGSPTQVDKIFPPEKNENKEIFDGSASELAGGIFGLLKKGKFI